MKLNDGFAFIKSLLVPVLQTGIPPLSKALHFAFFMPFAQTSGVSSFVSAEQACGVPDTSPLLEPFMLTGRSTRSPRGNLAYTSCVEHAVDDPVKESFWKGRLWKLVDWRAGVWGIHLRYISIYCDEAER